MKNLLKRTALFLLIAALCISLCSCQYLDDAKARAAYYADDSKESFTFRDYTYRKIGYEHLKNFRSFIMDDTYYDNQCHAATQDIPVLMAARFGDLMTFNATDEAPAVITVYPLHVDEDAWTPYQDTYTYVYYAREDQYDRIISILEESEIDRYFTHVDRYNYDEWDGRLSPSSYLLDEETSAAVKRTLSGGEAAEWRDLIAYDCYTVTLYPCDSEMMITNGTTYLLVTNSVDYYLCDEITYTLKKVGEDDYELMRRLYSLNRSSAYYADPVWYANMHDRIVSEGYKPD